jgi:CheY-like chemotaxis protein/predicted regulator of Ras-like GTPase activity (Roadblock/LC7/MglB family)
VIYDLKTPGADGFELLQWLRASRPNTHMIIVGGANAPAAQIRALEGGAVSYLEEPLDFRVLKEELRRLLQRTGFSASLDSFDLLDVIQIITMSRKSIALLVNTGLEERGTLRFQSGELIWAEYGVLRGEEAFFALAAHKNGTVIHQPWDGQAISNVIQPLSRLIFQALQYRTKYASSQQYSGEIEPVQASALSSAEIDDTPFLVFPPSQPQTFPMNSELKESVREAANSNVQKEWWEQTGSMASAPTRISGSDYSRDDSALDGLLKAAEMTPPLQGQNSGVKQRTDLPSWLTDQPTASDLPIIKPASRTSSSNTPPVPSTPALTTPSEEWNVPRDQVVPTNQVQPKQPTPPSNGLLFRETETLAPPAPEWNLSQPTSPFARQDVHATSRNGSRGSNSGSLAPLDAQDSNPLLSSGVIKTQQAASKNYAALVSALQTLGYTLAGFVAAAIVTIDGQPIAQVALDDMDISKMCKYFSTIQKGILVALDQEEWGGYEDTVITSAGRSIIMRMIGSNKSAFLVLMTTRNADSAECLTVIRDVEETINQALHS